VTNLTRFDLALLDVETGAVLSQWRSHNDSEIFDIAYSRDGRLIAASSHENVKVWDVATRLALGP
jgi:WD40 repeat protein